MNYYAPFYRNNYSGIPTQMPYQAQYQPQGMVDNQLAPQVQNPVQSPTANDMMIWVLNENEATAYPVAPNNSVVLWDKNQPTIYIKSADANGVPSMRVLDFEERNTLPKSQEHVCKCSDKYVTKDDFSELQEEFEKLKKKIDSAQPSTAKKTKKAEVTDDE